MPKKSFNKDWEKNIYSKGKQLNLYPYDILVSIVVRKFFDIPYEKRKKIKVLDLGCGAGNNSKFLAENGFDVYGIDGSASAVKTSKERFKRWNLKGNFIRGDFLDLPYKNNFFDLIIDRESIYANTFNNIKNIINGVYRKLKSNGFFISFIYNTYHPDKRFGREMEQNTYKNFPKGSFQEAGVAHFFDMKEVLKLYSKFRIENIMRNSLREVYNNKQKFMGFDEYIIIAKK